MPTPRLLHNLHTMSLAKAASEGLKDRECKRITLRKCPPIPYVPEEESVQETVSSLKTESLKIQIGEGTEPQVSIWHFGTCEAFFIHVGSAMDTIKKRGHFKAHVEANDVEQHALVKQVKAALVELDRTTGEGAGTSKKSSKKHKEAAATADTPEPNL